MKMLLAFVAMVALTTPFALIDTAGNDGDQRAIKSIEASWESAWNRHDMKALGALVAEDIDFVTVAGNWLKGRAEFEKHHVRVHEMQFKDSVWTAGDVRIRFLKPDVAVVHVNWGLKGDRDPDGTPRQPRRGIFTRVVTKHGDKWLIVASQNTNVRESAPAK